MPITKSNSSRYNLTIEQSEDEYLSELQMRRWRGHKDFSKIIIQIIREYRHLTEKHGDKITLDMLGR